MNDERIGKKSSLPQLVNTNEAARILGRSPATLKRWRTEGIGPKYIQIHNRTRYDVSELLAYIEQHTKKPSVRAAMEESLGAL